MAYGNNSWMNLPSSTQNTAKMIYFKEPGKELLGISGQLWPK